MNRRENAETFALEVLAWVASQDDLLSVFLGSSGMSQSDLRDRAGDGEFLGAVLDFVLMDDAWVLGASEALGRAPEDLLKARATLPGGQQVHWT